MEFDVIVVGAGHAGLEAAFASAHMGAKTLLITLNKHMMGNMPCNPSMGGSAKGIVIREIDALGGVMGVATDAEYIQMKMLNTGKGPGVQCLRAQVDKKRYPIYMKNWVEKTPNITLKEAMVTKLLHDEHHVFGVELSSGERYQAKAVIMTTGTYMESEVLQGLSKRSAGPDGELPSHGLSPYLASMGIELFRLKTGTPPRLKKDSIDYSKMVPQYATEGDLAFSFETKTFKPFKEQAVCYLIHTTSQTHQIIMDHLDQSSMYGGLVSGVGPRYCPSIEDKVVRFKDKERHQLFIEPESLETDSMYLQGFSTSMPIEIQEKMVRSLPGLEKVEFLKYAYAIEYDAIKPTQMHPTLEMKRWPGLYVAGQILGTSGYEEAAAAGLVAGINAVLKIRQQEPMVLRRDEAYIGVMIDDLVTKGTSEPYRLLSSRAEYRLLLRHDNADLRLSDIGYRIGLIAESRYGEFVNKRKRLHQAYAFIEKTFLKPTRDLLSHLSSLGHGRLQGGISGLELLRRQDMTFNDLLRFMPDLETFHFNGLAIMQFEIMVKFEGYIEKQKDQALAHAKYESLLLPEKMDYLSIEGLAMEARQKLHEVQPRTIGQASRISGVNPTDIANLVMVLKKKKHEFSYT